MRISYKASLNLKPKRHYPLTTMTGLTIDELLKGHTIMPGATMPEAKSRGWFLDAYGQPFPHKIYAAITAVALTEAKEKISFHDLKVYALRIIAADGSEDYFKGERGFSAIDSTDFSAEVGEMKASLASSPLSAADLEAVIGSDLRTIENRGGMKLRMMAMDINEITKQTMNRMKNRKGVPYLKPLKDADKPRTLFYALTK